MNNCNLLTLLSSVSNTLRVLCFTNTIPHPNQSRCVQLPHLQLVTVDNSGVQSDPGVSILHSLDLPPSASIIWTAKHLIKTENYDPLLDDTPRFPRQEHCNMVENLVFSLMYDDRCLLKGDTIFGPGQHIYALWLLKSMSSPPPNVTTITLPSLWLYMDFSADDRTQFIKLMEALLNGGQPYLFPKLSSLHVYTSSGMVDGVVLKNKYFNKISEALTGISLQALSLSKDDSTRFNRQGCEQDVVLYLHCGNIEYFSL